MKLLNTLEAAKAIHPPKWMIQNVAYMVIMGSHAYGVNSSDSDFDVYGFCVPPIEMVFPHLKGEIPGFGTQTQRFDVWSEHHIKKPSNPDVEYDFSIYGIVKYFQLCMENNPNMIDSLFVPDNCVMYSNHIGNITRENRRIFLHKGAWHKFKGYAYSQVSKIKNKVNSSNPKRAETIEKFGYDIKFAYHVVRLLNEVEQILVEGDLDLLRNNEQLKSIRRGEWSIEEIEQYFKSKELHLETAYANSKLPHSPDETEIKKLLMKCLEERYGSLSLFETQTGVNNSLLNDLQELVKKYA